MPTSSEQKHLDKLLNTAEAKLTPKEWVIKFVGDFRQHPTLQEFFKATAKGAFRESVYLKPYFALSQQAQNRYPGSEPQEISARNNLEQHHRMELQSLRILVLRVNRAIAAKVDMFRLIGLVNHTQLRYVERLKWLDDSQTTLAAGEWIKRCKSNNGNRKNKRKILESFATYARVMEQEALTSLIGSWACMNAILLAELYAYDMALQVVQDKYFGGHPILTQELEAALKDGIETLSDAISMLNETQKERFDLLAWTLEPASRAQKPKERPDPIDVEAIRKGAREEMVDEIVNAWVTAARNEGVARILQETGEDLDFIWENFVKKFGAKN
jgi:hypothetical protein